MSTSLEQYGLIGDCETAALVSRDGAVDWLCAPRFDSEACFAGLLGSDANGTWKLAPAGDFTVARWRYLDDTLVLETTYEAERGTARVLDFMPPRERHPELVRLVEGLEGEVEFQSEFAPRFDYGDLRPHLRVTEDVLWAEGGPLSLRLVGAGPAEIQDGRARVRFSVRAGETRALVLSCLASPCANPTSRLDPAMALRETVAWWRRWTAQCDYRGPHRATVLRSLVTLKALTYAPTGGIVAAPTTSLPEKIGGCLNWDYRFCWLRDASFTLSAFLGSGLHEEARAWRDWLLRAVGDDPAKLRVVYGVAGERRLPEIALDHLAGYEGSRPVRIGNAAESQFQLDVFGELAQCLSLARAAGLSPRPELWRIQHGLIDHLEKIWNDPDHGIWESRGDRQPFTYSRAMAWVAVSRALHDAKKYRLPCPRARWRRLAASIREQVLRDGYDPDLGALVQSYGSRRLDASLLRLAMIGVLPADDPRMLGTIDAIERRLMTDGLVRRYIPQASLSGTHEEEGVFLSCTFWLADVLARAGRRKQAEATFERVLSLRNELGLLSEEYDPQQRRLVGNFPQALSHIALINCALTLYGAAARETSHQLPLASVK